MEEHNCIIPRICLLICGLLLIGFCYGQSYLTSTQTNVGNPGGLNTESDGSLTGWTLLQSGNQPLNLWSSTVSLPFSFTFYGQSVSHFKASLNGILSFDTTATLPPGPNTNLPSLLIPDLTIAAFWDHFTINPPTGSNDQLRTKVFGQAPNRQFWLKWYSFEIGNPTVSFSYFCIVLEEGTNRVYIVDQNSSTTSPALTATVGLQLNSSTAIQIGNDSIDFAGNGSNPIDNDYYEFIPVAGANLDVMALGITMPEDLGCGSSDAAVQMQIWNVGLQPASNILASFSLDGTLMMMPETIAGPLAVGDTLLYTFLETADLSSPGPHSILAVSSLVGDGDPINDSTEINLTTIAPNIPPLPLVDFSGYNGTNLNSLYPDWSEADGLPDPSGIFSDWIRDDFANVPQHPNGDAARFNFYLSFRHEWILGPKIIPSNQSYLIYDLALCQSGGTDSAHLGSDDVFQIMLSTDCGQSYFPAKTFDINSAISPQGQSDSLDLSGYAGQEVFVAFMASEGLINDTVDVDLFIDNISITTLFTEDLGISEIVTPELPDCFGSAETATVKVQNYGTGNIDFTSQAYSLNLEVSGANTGFYSTLLDSGVMNAGDSWFVTITDSLSLINPGLNFLTAYSLSDSNSLNDSSFLSLESLPLLSAPFVEDFENFIPGDPGTLMNGWIQSTQDDRDWYVEQDGVQNTPQTGPINDHSPGGNTYLYIETSSPAQPGDIYELISPCIDLSSTAMPHLVYWYHMYGAEIGSLEVKVSYGDSISSLSLISGQQQSAETDPWLSDTLNLSPYAGGEIQLIFTGVRSNGIHGDIALDDVSVVEFSQLDLEAKAILSPLGTACYGTNETVAVLVENVGQDVIDFTSNPVSMEMSIQGPISASFDSTLNSGTLGVGDSLVVVLSEMANLSVVGTYDMQFALSLMGDANKLNDSLNAVAEQNLVFSIPYFEDFETFTSGSPGLLENGWKNAPDDDQDWFVEIAGVQNSGSTGPIDNHTPSGSKYLYTEASSPAAVGDHYDLLSPCVNLDGSNNPAFSFWYHMYGEEMGSLEVFLISDGADTSIFSISGQQQASEVAEWALFQMPLSAFSGVIQLRFRGTKGSGFKSDMAIDDVRFFELPDVDLSPISLVEPADPSCLMASQELLVSIGNFGGDTIDFSVDPLELQVEISGPLNTMYSTVLDSGKLASFDTVLVSLDSMPDLTQAGIYTFNIYSIVSADTINTNDSLTTTRHRINSLYPPLTTVDFSAYTGANLSTVFPGWEEAKGEILPIAGFSNWNADVFANNAANTNGTAARFNYFGSLDYDWMIGPQFIADSTTWLCYDIALTGFNEQSDTVLGSDDRLDIMLSTDCGASFFSIKSYTSLSSISNTGQTDSILLKDYDGEELIIGFLASEGTVFDPNETDLFIDNIQIKKVIPGDIQLLSVNGPESGCMLGPDSIQILITNAGTDTVQMIEARFQLNGGSFTSPESIPGPLAPGDSLSYTFMTVADFSAVGPYEVRAIATAIQPIDEIPSNDTLSLHLVHIPLVDSYPYYEDFENGPGGWIASGSHSSWVLGTPNKPVINGAASGLNAWVNGKLDSLYSSEEKSMVMSPCFDFTNAPLNAWVSLNIWWETESGWDGAVLQSSSDGGDNWVNVGEFSDPFNWFNDDNIDALAVGQNTGWSGRQNTGDGSNTWLRAKHPLDGGLIGLPDVRFRIAFGADLVVEDEGFAFDDFVIAAPPVPDLGPDSMKACDGQTIDAGIGGLYYLWSTGDTTQSIIVENPTDSLIEDSVFYVTVTDVYGLCGSDTIVLSIAPSTLALDAIVIDSIKCAGDSTGSLLAMATGGAPPYSFEWETNPPHFDAMISNLPSGAYQVSVLDSFDCLIITQIQLTEPDSLGILIDTIGFNPCPDDAVGFIEVSPFGGNPPYSYEWSNAMTTEDLSNLVVGNYSLMLMDDHDCINVFPPLEVGANSPFPEASFTYMPVGALIHFSSTSIGANNYLWEFGDGGISTQINPSHEYTTNDTFVVKLTIDNFCGVSTFFDTLIITKVNIDPLAERQSIQLYPNPNQGQFELMLKGGVLQQAELIVYDLQGRKVYTEKLPELLHRNRYIIRLPHNMAKGRYLLGIHSTDGYWYHRLILE